jgi:hypothetical protein
METAAEVAAVSSLVCLDKIKVPTIQTDSDLIELGQMSSTIAIKFLCPDPVFALFCKDAGRGKFRGGAMMKKLKPVSGVFLVLVLVPVFATWVFAGNLEPSADPTPTMHSLKHIYDLIANIGTAPVEKTGQTLSYTTGDDGDLKKGIAWPASRFTDNGDGTVTDHLTGLIWMQDANRADKPMVWADALAYCNNLKADGETLTDGSAEGDWRLPNVNELLSLIDFSHVFVALPTGHPFTGVLSTDYWSSTTRINLTTAAWNVHMGNCNVTADDKTDEHHIWPVRGGGR